MEGGDWLNECQDVCEAINDYASVCALTPSSSYPPPPPSSYQASISKFVELASLDGCRRKVLSEGCVGALESLLVWVDAEGKRQIYKCLCELVECAVENDEMLESWFKGGVTMGAVGMLGGRDRRGRKVGMGFLKRLLCSPRMSSSVLGHIVHHLASLNIASILVTILSSLAHNNIGEKRRVLTGEVKGALVCLGRMAEGGGQLLVNELLQPPLSILSPIFSLLLSRDSGGEEVVELIVKFAEVSEEVKVRCKRNGRIFRRIQGGEWVELGKLLGVDIK